MLKKYYYILAVPIICLLFSTTVNAATSAVTTSTTITSGETIQLRGQTYTGIDPSYLGELANVNQNVVYSTGQYDISENINILNMTSGKFYNGILYFGLVFTLPRTGMEIHNVVINETQGNGIRYFIGAINNNRVNVAIIFDNYYHEAGELLGIPTINIKFTTENLPTTAGSLSLDFPMSISVSGALVSTYDMPENNGLTAMIYSAIYQGVGPDMQTIVNILTGIRNQDYTYYNSILNGLSQLHADNQANYNQLLAILNEIDVDFAAIQTVLDLFPSYRTAVLQYWQDLLEMSATQSSAAAEIESQYADKEQQSATLAAGLGSLTLPSVNANDFDILSRVDSGQKTNFFGLLSIITNNSYITTLLLIICTGAIVGFILYGKKS